MNANYTHLSSNSLDDHVSFFDDTDVFWALDDALSVTSSSMFGMTAGTSSTNDVNVNNYNHGFSLLNAPRIFSIPLPIVEDFIPLHVADNAAPFPYLPTPPPTPPTLTIYLLSPSRSSTLRGGPQQGRLSPEGRAGKKSRPTSRPRRATDPGQLLRTVRKRRLIRRLNPIQDIETYLDNLELFDGGDVPRASPD